MRKSKVLLPVTEAISDNAAGQASQMALINVSEKRQHDNIVISEREFELLMTIPMQMVMGTDVQVLQDAIAVHFENYNQARYNRQPGDSPLSSDDELLLLEKLKDAIVLYEAAKDLKGILKSFKESRSTRQLS